MCCFGGCPSQTVTQVSASRSNFEDAVQLILMFMSLQQAGDHVSTNFHTICAFVQSVMRLVYSETYVGIQFPRIHGNSCCVICRGF